MRNIYLSILLFCPILSFSQMLTRGDLSKALMRREDLWNDTIRNPVLFSPVCIEQKAYVRWIMKNDHKNGLFVVERSPNGNDFEPVGFRDRISVDPETETNLFYSYIDQNPYEGESYYRIFCVGSDGSYRYTQHLKITCH